MKYKEKLEKVLKDIETITEVLESLICDTSDYDLQRILKKIDAQLMDAQHNLTLAKKIAGNKEKH